MQYKVRLRTAGFFGFAALVLIAGIILAAANSSRLSLFVASVGEGAYEKIFDKDPTEVESKSEEGKEEYEMLLQQEGFWHDRLTYPTGRFDPEWLREAVRQDAQVERAVRLADRSLRKAERLHRWHSTQTALQHLGQSPNA